MSSPATEWTSGKSQYYRLTHEGKPYAVLVGASISESEKVFAIRSDPNTKAEFFTNVASRVKSWELPDLLSGEGGKIAPSPNFRARVETMYAKYCPEKLSQVDRVVQQFGGAKEEDCMNALVNKYGPEPSPSTSTSATAPQPELHPSSAKGDIATRVRRFYEVYNPTKIALADKQLEKYKGHDDELIAALIAKYGPEPMEGSDTKGGDRTADPSPSQSPPQPTPMAASQNAPPEAAKPPSEPPQQGQAAGTPAEISAPNASQDDSPRNDRKPSIAPNSSTVPSAETAPQSPRNSTTRSSSVFKAESSSSPSGGVSRAASIALMEAENRERILTSFIQDRETRLAEAQQRYEVAMSAIESLRKTNKDLMSEMDNLRRESDHQVSSTRLEIDRIREESQISRSEWDREKQTLRAAVDEAAANAMKELQKERIRQEEQNVKFIGEKAALQSELHKAKHELEVLHQNSTNLIAVLDKQEKEHNRLVRQIDDLHVQLEGPPKSSRAVQTDPPAQSSSPPGAPSTAPGEIVHSASPSLHLNLVDGSSRSASKGDGSHSPTNNQRNLEATLNAIEEFDRVMATEKYRKGELEQLKAKCRQLERELSEARDSSFTALGKNCGPSPCDCVNKLKQLRATIGALRSTNKALEHRIHDLELRLVAQPEIASPVRPLSGASDPSGLREKVLMLEEQLCDSREFSKSQRREIQELRARLVALMASPNSIRR